MKQRYYVEVLLNDEWCPIVSMKTGKIIYRYQENTAKKILQKSLQQMERRI
ncbi:hypothetical protein MGH68_07185 [Erysipelothrix sp. D19-032]